MASSVSGQEESNPALWLATWVGKWSYLAHSGLPTVSCKKNCPESHIRNFYRPSFFGQDGWILASFFFCEFMNLDSVSVHEHAKKELGQYPAILTSLLPNNPYISVWTNSACHWKNLIFSQRALVFHDVMHGQYLISP